MIMNKRKGIGFQMRQTFLYQISLSFREFVHLKNINY